ncbi:MAG: hypothetical protein OXJ37_05950 [Bryobacterales bacterium]|nr:hypothetical protein [Bryobacterales bacterium]MDE0621406.1 hypothetical protein [Bryobacterales bacterium]
MSAELIGILSVGVALAALILTSVGRVRSELLGELLSVRPELRELASRVGTLEQRMARLEGLLEGAGLYRPAAAPEPRAATETAQLPAGG